ncbi:tyrosine-type recombinase/integrase [Flavicella sp.]|uniref:tyrosine-type recombinase/integrase n=1 Tax=Flavicella sp. TaxID=2957742 RepID=UPI00260CEF35|nr:tyrosine-type recombinase/integrase [Flavicella sp.]MDG1803815.1 tyrosine-type recombinase/integrase [Flavicella sp.]
MVERFIDYISLEKQYSKHTALAYKKDLETFQVFSNSECGTSDIVKSSYGEIRSWIVALVNEGVSNRTVNRKISSLNSFYKYLQRIEEIEANPLSGHKALKVAKRLQVPFSENEVVSVIEGIELDGFAGVRDKLLVELLYSTGMRREELIGLKQTSVDIHNNTLKVLGKRNKERYVPLLQSVKKTLLDYLEIKEQEFGTTEYLLVSNKGNKLYGTLVYRIIKLYFSRESTKVKKSPHVIRHSFATHMLNEGADLNSVKELLGHSSLASTQIYTHTSLDHLKEVYNQAHPRSKK